MPDVPDTSLTAPSRPPRTSALPSARRARAGGGDGVAGGVDGGAEAAGVARARAHGRDGRRGLPAAGDLARDLLPLPPAFRRGGTRGPRAALAPAAGLTGPHRSGARGGDLRAAPAASALRCTAHPGRAPAGGSRSLGHLDGAPGAAPQPPGCPPAYAQAEGTQALRARDTQRPLADRRHPGRSPTVS